MDCVIDSELDVSFFSLLSVVPIPPKLNAGFDVLLPLALGNENGVEGLSVDGVAKLNFLVAGSSVFLSSASVVALLVIPNLKGSKLLLLLQLYLKQHHYLILLRSIIALSSFSRCSKGKPCTRWFSC